MSTRTVNLMDVEFHWPPQVGHAEVSYAVVEDGYVRRTVDHSIPKVSFDFLSRDRMKNPNQKFDPENGQVPWDDEAWEPAQIE